jgi:hypothetical protein
MNKIKFYCVTNKKVEFINNFDFNLCWVGNGHPPKNYLRCDIGDNIFFKEKFYSELTFHYWYWKNLLDYEDKSQWIGFCQKRRFWIRSIKDDRINEFNLNEYLLKTPGKDWDNFDAILCNPISVHSPKKIKILKRGWRNLIKDPSILYNKKKQNLFLHFDMHHGYGNLIKAIDKLDYNNKLNFKKFMIENNSFNPHIMFIAKPYVMNLWFENLFGWLQKCEDVFNFNKLSGYDTGRLFAYLSERYLSYWFKKNFRCKVQNWVQLKNF